MNCTEREHRLPEVAYEHSFEAPCGVKALLACLAEALDGRVRKQDLPVFFGSPGLSVRP
jgi:hypothetical protein